MDSPSSSDSHISGSIMIVGRRNVIGEIIELVAGTWPNRVEARAIRLDEPVMWLTTGDNIWPGS